MDSQSSRRRMVSHVCFVFIDSHACTGVGVPLTSAGHSRQVLIDDGDMQKEVTIYETVYDVQFDPAK